MCIFEARRKDDNKKKNRSNTGKTIKKEGNTILLYLCATYGGR